MQILDRYDEICNLNISKLVDDCKKDSKVLNSTFEVYNNYLFQLEFAIQDISRSELICKKECDSAKAVIDRIKTYKKKSIKNNLVIEYNNKMKKAHNKYNLALDNYNKIVDERTKLCEMYSILIKLIDSIYLMRKSKI